MYSTLLIAHSLLRWLVVLSLLYSIYRGWLGSSRQIAFTKADNSLRHWTATIAHIQLMLGIVLYTQSPMVKFYFTDYEDTSGEALFFGIIHIILMLAAIVIITIGSAKAKRQSTDSQKFRTMLTYFGIGLLIIFVAIPWPFSPLAHRPLMRY
ncbi:hypothetical protein FMM05_07985 [Flavobacterium zepuense]|uniref:Cytochrome B n=1 Tax=Flavobacterium zepuense TaxID=2593302 RepID=A0A552V438_9FLAO|nr:hypothetical protein [Flavobacterium zepuense]TRW25236.1 hypothetical protein FMM05_07985 [Flavobacterium zepuense]